MVSARSATALVGLVASLAVSLALWFVPFLFRREDRPPVRECPVCGFRTRDEGYEYCPRDGHRLEE
jgi:hypothetical protein